jgi:hypothetical protein
MKHIPLLLAFSLYACAAGTTVTHRDQSQNDSPSPNAGATAPVCPAIACNSSIVIKGAFSLTFEKAKQHSFEICVNDECVRGLLAADASMPPAGAGTGFRVESSFGAGYLTFFSEADGSNWLELSWQRASEGDKKDGDSYRVVMLDDNGDANVLFDESVEYEARTTAPLPCAQTCLGLDLDLRE